MQIDRCNALVTGASAGIGREFARLLAPRVKNLILVARRRERLEELKSELLARNSGLSIHTFPTDLRSPAEVDALVRRLEQENIQRAIECANGRIYGPGGAADLLGLKPTTLAYRMKALGISRPPI